MSNTVVGFTIQIDGVNSINQLNSEIKQTKEAMNALDLSTEQGNKEFQELSQTLGKLSAQQKALKKTQDDVNKSFLEESSLGAYDKASAKLNKLRKEFKNAALDGSKSASELDKLENEIQQLDQTLKKVDGQVGQFQRNVGNYPRTFQRITRSLYAAIPGFEAFSGQLRTTEGGLSTFGKALIGGFVAFQAANLIGRAITSLEEFDKKITETRNTVMGLSGAYGTNLDALTAQTSALAETFGTDAKAIGEAAQALSKKMGISFEEALGKLEGALVEGRGDANEYLNKIKEYPQVFQEASSEMGEIAVENRRLLDSNKELAKSQIGVSKDTKQIVNTFKEFKNAAQSGMINVLIVLYNTLKPIGMAFYELGKTIFNFIGAILGVFSPANQTVNLLSLLGSTIQLVLTPITFLINLITGIIGALTYLAPVIAAATIAIGTFALAMNAGRIASALSSAALVIYNGAVIAYTAVVSAAKLAQEAFNNAIKANPIGLALTGLVAAGTAVAGYSFATSQSTQSTVDNTKAIEDQKKALDAQMQAEQKAAADKMKIEKDLMEQAAKDEEDKRKAEQKREEAARKYTQDVEKLTQERQKFLEGEVAAEKNALALLADLRSKYIDEQIKNIKDDQERQIKEITVGAERQAQALDEQFKKLQDDNQARAKEGEKQLKEAIRLQLLPEDIQKIRDENLKAEKAANEDEKKAAEEISNVKKEINKQTEAQINAVRAEFRADDLQKAKEAAEKLKEFRMFALSSEAEAISDYYEMSNLKNEEALNKALKLEKDAKKREKLIRDAAEEERLLKVREINNQIQALNDAEAQLLDEQKNLKVGITQEEYDKILLARQKLYTELSEEEKKQTEDVAKNSAEQTKIKQDQFNQIADYFKQGLDALAEVFSVVNERQQAAFDADIERSQLRQERLQEELDNSFGLRRRYYEQQLAAEVANQAAIEKAKEEARKRDAKRQKAIAIIQSIINTALAVTAALTAGGNPLKLATGAQIFEAAIIGALGAVQTGIIAAQPLAEGGVVGKLGDEIVQFADGGRVTSKGNIKPLSNGDNVLATLKTGEIVLNKEQQGRIGYSALKAAKIPNFALGGVVGAPSGFLQDSLNRANNEMNKMQTMESLIVETQNRIDRIQVIYTASTDDDVEKGRSERKEIRATASF
jgi:hypothetical protein